MNRRLAVTLSQVNKSTEPWISPDGSVILVLPYGGRILGLFTPESEKNFLWTHPALDSVETARALYQENGWHNSGGDRTWISPEVDFFLPRFPDLETYWQPREFDPGNYRLTREDGDIVLTNEFSYQLSRSRRKVDLEIRKRLAAALNPLRHFGTKGSISYAGYTLHTWLTFTNAPPTPTSVSLWSLLQLPFGGEFLIPTFSRSTVKPYLGSVDANDVSITDHLIRYRTGAPGLNKFGLSAPTATGRVGYLYSDAEDTSLIVRNFSIHPSGEYIDVPWTDPDGIGSAVEVCNVNNSFGKFSELEYHAPAITGFDNERTYHDESQVWAFRGPKSDIVEIARILGCV